MGNYQGYQKYQDSGVKWLGEIPEHWEQKRFKFSVNLINNKIEAENSNLSYMGLEHIESWTGKKIEDKNASSEGIGSHFLPNDVLFGNDSATFFTFSNKQQERKQLLVLLV